jgi:hypothetical protein
LCQALDEQKDDAAEPTVGNSDDDSSGAFGVTEEVDREDREEWQQPLSMVSVSISITHRQ